MEMALVYWIGMLLLLRFCATQNFAAVADFNEQDMKRCLKPGHFDFFKKHRVTLLPTSRAKDEYDLVLALGKMSKPYFVVEVSPLMDCERIDTLSSALNITIASDDCAFHHQYPGSKIVRLGARGQIVSTFLSSLFSSFKWSSFSAFYSAMPTYRFYAIGLIADMLTRWDIRLTDFGSVYELMQRRVAASLESKSEYSPSKRTFPHFQHILVHLYICNDADLQDIFSTSHGFVCNLDELHIIVNTHQIYLPRSLYVQNCSNIVQLFTIDQLNTADEVLTRFLSVFNEDEVCKLPFNKKRSMFELLSFLSHLTGRLDYPASTTYSQYLNASFTADGHRLFNAILGSKPNYESALVPYFETQEGVPRRMNQNLWNPPAPEHIFRTCADLRILLWGMLAIFAAIAVACVGIYVIRNNFLKRQMSRGPNRILLLPEDLIFIRPKKSIFSNDERSYNRSVSHFSDIVSVGSIRTLRSSDLKCGKTATFNGDTVWVKRLKTPNFTLKGKIIKEFRVLRDLRHENVNPFLGCYVPPSQPSLVYEYGHRGSLEDIIRKDEIKLDWNFKWSMLNDLVRGMRYLHHSSVKFHGALKSRNCVVDSRWVLKVTDYGLLGICNYPNKKYNIPDLLWTAPEHLRSIDVKEGMTGSQSGDVFSFAIILQEIILRSVPYSMMALSYDEIISKIKKPPPLLRPSVSKQAAPPEYINIMRECWAEQPDIRPSFDELSQRFKTLNTGKKVNIVDTMFRMLEQYSNNLEELIQQRTVQLEEEKKKTEKLLSEMLPRSVSEALKLGQPVPAEQYDCVTIYFSDIVGFTTISALSEPIQIVGLLNDLYTMFDSIVMSYDCYKVETIGDAYMVVSGLPIRNGDEHAAEIAKMTLDLLHHCGRFKISHMPGVPLMLRIGIHSGPCVAGVVGLKMPRYCLFGDTVNTASRMESTSQAYRIHVSQSTAEILKKIGGFHLEHRGKIELKGKGKQDTYWLTGRDGFDKELPKPVISECNHGLDKDLVRLAEERSRKSNQISDQVLSQRDYARRNGFV